MQSLIEIPHFDIGNVCSFLNLNIHTNEWTTPNQCVCASLRLIFSRRCSNVACLLVKIWYVCVCDCKSCSALKKVKTGRIYSEHTLAGALKERELYGREFVKHIFTLKYITLDDRFFVKMPNGSNCIQINLI